MYELNYNNQIYYVIYNSQIKNRLNLIFVNMLFIKNKLYKKYVDFDRNIYLIEK